jgi:opacity protein-like surface antigen
VLSGVPVILRTAASICAAATIVPSAAAEPFVDIYVGPGQMRDTTVTAEHTTFDFRFFAPEPTTQTSARAADFDTAISYGIRAGWWLQRSPRIGIAFDFAQWEADAESLEAGINMLSASLLYRWNGTEGAEKRFAPYVGFGLTIFDTNFNADFRPAIAQSIKVASQDPGYSAQAGISWRVQRTVTLLLEYRLVRSSGTVEARSQSETIRLYAPTDTLRARIDARQLLAGVSFRF